MIEPGQVWEFCGALTVLTVRPRPDLDRRYSRPGRKLDGAYWDTLYLIAIDSTEDEGRLDWIGIEEGDPDWVRLA